MKSFSRLVIIGIVTILITAGITFAQDTPETFTISGSAGIDGVAMLGLPGNTGTDQNGYYSVSVPLGWAGKVTPNKKGYKFIPPVRIYSAVNEDMTNQDYRAELLSYTITGSVGIDGVVMQDLPGNPVTDHSGRYRATVPNGWSGRVKPSKEGYTFVPDQRLYHRMSNNLDNQNYEATQILLVISGEINIPGVFLEGLPGAPITDKDGRYRARVPYGWSGTVVPEKEGYEMTPPGRSYSAVTKNLNDQDFFAEPQMFTISDTIMVDGAPIPGVKITTDDGISAVTNAQGRYTIKVPYGWSGEITLSKEGYTFDPPGKSYSNVLTNFIDGAPVPTARRPAEMYAYNARRRMQATIPSAIGRTGSRRILVVPAADIEPEELAGTVEDLYVFSYILDDRFKEPRMIQGVFRDFGDFFGRDNRETEAIYMQDYGAVFMMEVDYTFTPVAQTQEQAEDETAEDGDPTWQQTRERIFSGRRRINRTQAGPDEGRMVEELKAELIRTLKHAKNIRNLMPDEWVILSVTGRGPQSGMGMMGGFGGYGQSSTRFRASSSSRVSGYGGGGMGGYGGSAASGGFGGSAIGGGYGGGGMGGYGSGMMGGRGEMYGGSEMMGSMGGYAETGIPQATIMTIRVKKTDVDAFAEGEMTFEKFRQKVQILMN